MFDNVVLGKTPLGEAALARHDRTLPPSLRRTLILVDGRSDGAALRAKAPYPDLEAALEQLFRDGYVAPAGESAVRAGTHSSRELKASLARVCREVLGEAVAEKMAAKLVTTPDDPAELAAAFRACVRLVRLTIDEGKAAELQRRGEALF